MNDDARHRPLSSQEAIVVNLDSLWPADPPGPSAPGAPSA